MDFSIISTILKNSDATEWIFSDELGAYTFKHEPQLRIQRREIESDTFQEEWVKNFPDSNAHKVIFDVFFNLSWIKTFVLVSVDGGRAIIPMPTSANSGIVSCDDYMFAKIVSPGRLDDSMHLAGLNIPITPIATK